MADKRVKPVPLALSLFSFFYLVYVITQGNSKMAGDEIGGDPGGQLLPLIFSLFLFVGSVYLTLKERPGEAKVAAPGTGALFAWTLVGGVLYVLCFRALGFILCTSLLTTFLIYLYGTARTGKAKAAGALGACLCGAVASVLIYTLCRFVTRSLLVLGRRGAIPAVFSQQVVIVILCAVLTALYLWLLSRFMKGKEGDRALAGQAVLIAVGTTEFLYLVFKQLFLVELVRGVIYW